MGTMLAQAWDAVGGDPSLLGLVEIPSGRQAARSSLAVGELASASTAAATLAAAELLAARRREDVRPVLVDPDHALAAFASERRLQRDGAPAGPGWHPLSRFWRTADGWIRLQCNYPHHRDRALAVLGHPGCPARAIVDRSSLELEEAIIAAGGCAAAARDEAGWRSHPHAAAVGAEPLVRVRERDSATPPRAPRGGAVLRAAQGIRVLDLTRVIAGPACTRFLAAHGADVLRVDSPALPELPGHHLDGDWGKRSTRLDLADRRDREIFERLLETAHVFVQGYRPGALTRFGLDPESIANRHPGIVTVSICAWGPGPWQRRRGFDSLVQAAVGIARAEGPAHGQACPGALPVQALDHGTAYLAAAATFRALARRARGEAGCDTQLSLARTARWLLDQPRTRIPRSDEPAVPGRFEVTRASVHGSLTSVPPPGQIRGAPPPLWNPPGMYGTDPPQWSDAGSA